MSTRATIIVVDSKLQRQQFYHHTDGYPEYMGEALKSFLFTANVCTRNEEDINSSKNMFLDLLEKEGCFEPEELGLVHGDIEYMWFVRLNEWGTADTITYTPFDFGIDKEGKIRRWLIELEGEKTYAEL